MNDLLQQLHDIEGIDPVGMWPLAIGWWIIIAIGGVALIAAAYFAIRRLVFLRSWRGDTLKKLAALERELTESSSTESVVLLSEYLRRIAVARFGRNACAALSGQEWLSWLRSRDPKQFDWEREGKLLATLPYAPKGVRPPVGEVRKLIVAAKEWVQ